MLTAKKRTALVAAAVMVAAMTAEAGAGSNRGSGESVGGSVTIAAVQPLTGFGAAFGQSELAGLKLGLADGQKKYGVHIKLVVEDTASSDTTGINALQLALSSRPAAIWGPYLGTELLAMRPVLEQAGVPLLATTGTHSVTENGNKDVFRWYTDQGRLDTVAPQWAVKHLGIKRPAILYDSTSYGQDGSKFIASTLSALGAAPVSMQSVDPTDVDMSGQVAQIQAAKPDAVFVEIIGGTTGAVALKALRNAGVSVPIISGSGIVSYSLLNLVSDAQVNGVYGSEPGKATISPGSENPAVVQFLNRFQRSTGDQGDLFSLAAYDAGMFFATAVANGAKTPQQFLKVLRTKPFKGLLATYRADSKGNMIQSVTIIRMHNKTPVKLGTFGR